MDLSKTIMLFFIFFFKLLTSFGQVSNCFLKLPGLKELTKSEFLKVDSIQTDNANYRVSAYTIIISSTKNNKSVFEFKNIKGTNYINYELKKWVTSFDTCLVTFDEIFISRKEDYPFKPTLFKKIFSVSIK